MSAENEVMSTKREDDGYILDERGLTYREFTGPPGLWDVIGAQQFLLLVKMGMRGSDDLLDIGCGSLRGGRLSIMYLDPGRYYGFDPNFWLIEEAIRYEIGQDLVDLKRPTFSDESNFTCSRFGCDKFKFIIARSVLSHASLAQCDRCLSEVAKALRRDGVFLASMHIDGKERYTGGWSWPACSHHLRGDIEELADEHALTMEVLADEERFGGQQWIAFRRKE